MSEVLQMRVTGQASGPTLVYLPGLHGDWTLVGSLRAALQGRVRFVEFTYPRTLTWSLADYAQEIEVALAQAGITQSWLLAESFGSQIGWELVARAQARPGGFEPQGVILAGGFGKHPWPGGVRLAQFLMRRTTEARVRRFLRVYAWYGRWRHRHAPETLADLPEFVARRTDADLRAMEHRLRLIAGSDGVKLPERGKSGVRPLPVMALAGFWDPVVWPWAVRRWLRREVPGFRGSRILFGADHNVLAATPLRVAEILLHWMGVTSR